MKENIPIGWRKSTLGKILRYEQPNKFIVNDTNYDVKSGIPVLTAGKSFILGFSKETQNIYKELPVIIFDDFTTDSKFVNFPFKVKSSAMKFLKENSLNEINLKFIFEKIQTLKLTETGSDHKRRWISEFSKIEILYPEYEEQNKIAEILSKVDKAISETEIIIAKYNRIKTGLMQDLLTKGIDKIGNIRSEETHEFKDSPLGRIPKEWQCDKLVLFCQKIQDGTHFSPKTDANGNFKYLTSKNIRMGYLDLSNVEFLTEVEHTKIFKRCSVQFGDVLLTKDGASTGNICLNTLYEEFSLLSSVALIRGKKRELSNEFIFQFFMEESGQKSLIDQMSGNAIPRITLTKINNTLIKVPSFSEQELILKRLKPQDKLINDEKVKLSKLKSIKTGLMHDLLSGKKRVTHLIN